MPPEPVDYRGSDKKKGSGVPAEFKWPLIVLIGIIALLLLTCVVGCIWTMVFGYHG
jgi:hypothetical protein